MVAYRVDREGQREVLAVEPDFFDQCAGEDQPGDKAEKSGGGNAVGVENFLGHFFAQDFGAFG